ncbi:MAG: hypothetical protein AB7F88_08570 [Pyrinomonadaceae bacterium]
MNVRQILLFTVILPMIGLFVGASPAAAQFGSRIPIVEAAKRPVSSGLRRVRRPRRPTVVQKVNNRVVVKTEVVRASNLSVTTEPGAKVVLTPIGAGGRAPQSIIASRDRSAVFENLRPGNYRISAAKEGFDTQEQDLVKILPQKTHVLDLDLKPVTYQLKIQTNLADGEVRYAQAINKGRDSKGSIISEEIGNYCIVKIQKNGEALVSDLRQGYYNLDIRPAALEYEQTLVGVNVPDDTEQDDETVASETKTFEIDVEKKISTETFGTAWTADEWEMPKSWSLQRGMKINNALGAAFPRNEQYRYYTDFELISDLRIQDGGTAGFALRAADAENYYYVEFSGARAAEPNVAKAYIVRKGVARQIFAAPASGFASALASKNGFRVSIKADDNTFLLSIENSETGAREPVGQIIDRDSTFRKGAVGIASRSKTRFDVTYFEVCPNKCR